MNANYMYLDVYWGIGNLTAAISSKKKKKVSCLFLKETLNLLKRKIK